MSYTYQDSYLSMGVLPFLCSAPMAHFDVSVLDHDGSDYARLAYVGFCARCKQLPRLSHHCDTCHGGDYINLYVVERHGRAALCSVCLHFTDSWTYGGRGTQCICRAPARTVHRRLSCTTIFPLGLTLGVGPSVESRAGIGGSAASRPFRVK